MPEVSRLKTRRLKIIQDYAHHPTEVKVTLEAVRQKYPTKQIWCIFQPHQYERTYYLFKDFVKVLAQAPIDKLILAPIYSVAGRESQTIKNKVNSQKLATAIKQIHNAQYTIHNTEIIYTPSIPKIADYLRKNLKNNDILVIMGAGDIYKLPEFLDNRIRN